MLKTRRLLKSLRHWTVQRRTQAQHKSFKNLSSGNYILPKSRSKSTAVSAVENEKDIEELTHFGYQQVNKNEKSERGEDIFLCVSG